MNSPLEAHYDRSLLAQAPVATRAQLQEGYDHVLLAPNRRTKRTESDLVLNEPSVEPKAHAAQTSNTQSFWRRRWKAIVGVLVILVVIAAIVGGAVGATSRKKKSDADTVGTGTLSVGQSGIFGLPSSTTSEESTVSPSKTLSQDSVGIATQPIASADIFVPRSPRHGFTARRRLEDDDI
ncbi:hypothetical protein B0H19DRAFT_1172395 [Mycena capillaripes]|nr:hypothetical protein B0H19DRAFT_1172395 [Mycena capillaripes]